MVPQFEKYNALDLNNIKQGGYRVLIGLFKKLVIAGSFGSGIDMENAAYIGLIPQDLLSVAGTAGNASLAGATLYALDTGFGDRLKSFCGRAKTLELSETPEFSARYISYMGF